MPLRKDIDMLLATLERMLPFTEREQKIARLSLELGKCVKEDEIVYCRELFKGEDDD